jgi:hypothetical protein
MYISTTIGETGLLMPKLMMVNLTSKFEVGGG